MCLSTCSTPLKIMAAALGQVGAPVDVLRRVFAKESLRQSNSQEKTESSLRQTNRVVRYGSHLKPVFPFCSQTEFPGDSRWVPW